MKLNIFTKKGMRTIHFWATIIVALPLFIIICTGILLMVKKEVSWIQPPTQKGMTQSFTVPPDTILSQLQNDPLLSVHHWSDVKRLDIRPSKGIIKIQLDNRIEVQMDGSTGTILQRAERNSDVIESLHDGSFFSAPVKYGLFLLSAIVLLLQLITGVYLFLISPRLKKKQFHRYH